MVLDNGRGTGDFGNIRRVAMISVHTSPLARLGSKDAGGLNVYVRELSRQLGRQGLAVDIFTRRTDAETPEIVVLDENVRVIHLAAGPVGPVDKHALFTTLAEFSSNVALFALRGDLDYDLIHAHYWLSGWVALQLRRRWGVPVVQMFHTLAALKKDAARGAADGDESQLRLDIERRIIHEVDAIVAANAKERSEMTWWYGLRTPKVYTIPCGIDLTLFQPQDRAAARQALGLGAAPTLLYVGRIDPAKGIDFLIGGFAALRANWTGDIAPELLIVGGEVRGDLLDPGLQRVRALAAEHGITDGLHFCGGQTHERLPAFYAAADITVVPSRYESFGLVAVESLACGTPVVAARTGGLVYTVEDDYNGFLVPFGDEAALAGILERTLQDDRLRARLSRGAIASAQDYGWEGVAEQVLDLYDMVANTYDLSERLVAVGD